MMIRFFTFSIALLVAFSCGNAKMLSESCDWEYLKYPVVRKGFIGKDSSAQGEICFQRKWKSYVGLPKNCIIELLGEPAEVEKNIFVYYFGDAERDSVVGVLHIYFREGKMKKVRCKLA